MVDNVGAFLGTWYVGMTAHPPTASPTGDTETAADKYLLKAGYQLVIGTGENNATPPFLTEGYKTCVGFAVLDENGAPVLTTGDGENDPLLFLFTNGSLRYAGYYNKLPLRIYISMAEAVMPTVGTVYPAIYGTTSSGDPDQVGVWGAEGNPPPSPKQEDGSTAS
jgi:hypothetical protein